MTATSLTIRARFYPGSVLGSNTWAASGYDKYNTTNAAKKMEQMGEAWEIENPMVNENLARKKSGLCLNFKKMFSITAGVISYEQKRCTKEKAMATFCEEVPKYGPQLEVPLT